MAIHEDDEEHVVADSRSEKPETLDAFLRGMHETSTKSTDANGIPSLTWLKQNFKSKSGIIRYLKQLGMSAQDAAAHTGFKYQHVYNVMHQHLKRGPNEVYVESKWQCSHDKSQTFIDVIVRKGLKDPDSSRVLYRVCTSCASGLIPGVNADSLKTALPGIFDKTQESAEK